MLTFRLTANGRDWQHLVIIEKQQSGLGQNGCCPNIYLSIHYYGEYVAENTFYW
jgi:hypothetical protein